MKPQLLVASLLVAAPSLWAADFEKDILPIFSARCADCHMDGSSKGGIALDLDRIVRDIGNGKSIVPGDPSKSDFVAVLELGPDDDDRMPPRGNPLSAREVNLIKEWITEGAKVPGMDTPDKTASTTTTPAAGIGSAPKPPQPLEGDWTSAEGKTIRATLMRVDGNIAVLRMGTRDFNYPIAKLSPESQAKVKQFAGAK